jgi:hypothetical protein
MEIYDRIEYNAGAVDYETLNIRATLAATSDDDKFSSSTCFSTPRSTGIQISMIIKITPGHEQNTHQIVQTSAREYHSPPES